METLCATVAGGYGQAEALEKLADGVFELGESLRNFGQTPSVTGGAAPFFPSSLVDDEETQFLLVLRQFKLEKTPGVFAQPHSLFVGPPFLLDLRLATRAASSTSRRRLRSQSTGRDDERMTGRSAPSAYI
jgi:hypothetical protein